MNIQKLKQIFILGSLSLGLQSFAIASNAEGETAWSAYFASGSANKVVQTELQKMTSTLADKVKSQPGSKISLIGHTDATGSAEVNEALSRKRAELIKSILVKKGVSPDSIEVSHDASRNPAADNTTASGRLMNRRVEILFQGAPALTAAVAPVVETTTKVVDTVSAPAQALESVVPSKVSVETNTSNFSLSSILPWLLAALSLGGILGWFLRGLGISGLLQSEKENTHRALATLKQKEESYLAQISGINGRLDSEMNFNAKRLKELEGNVSHLNTEISLRDKKIAELEGYQTRLDTAVKDLAHKDTDLGLKTKTLVELQNQFAAYKADADHKISRIVGLESELAKYQHSITERDTKIKSQLQQISDFELELRAAQTDKFRTEGKVAELTKQLAELQIEKDSKTRTAAISELFGKKITQDDLKLVEGIGPKIEELFHQAGITTWRQLSELSVERCREILMTGGERYRIHDPSTWPRQCLLAANGEFETLKRLQDELNAGRDSVGPITL